MQPETPAGPRAEWKAMLATRPGAYHRVERAGAHPTEDPVAVVKDAKDTIAIAANQELLAALRLALPYFDMMWPPEASGTSEKVRIRELCHAAVAKAEGRKR